MASSTPGLLDYTAAPVISIGGYFTPAQVQAQVNLAYARNDARTATQIRQAQGDLAGRGYSGNSPLLEVLKVGYAGQNFRASNEAATQIRWQAAKDNGDSILATQQAAAGQFNQFQQVFLGSEQNTVTRQVGLLSAVAQMVGGIA